MQFDPDLYGPPTIFQFARLAIKEQTEWLAAQYREACRPYAERLKRYPRDRRALYFLAEADREFHEVRAAMAKPFVDILMAEPPGPWILKDGGLSPIEDCAPMMQTPFHGQLAANLALATLTCRTVSSVSDLPE